MYRKCTVWYSFYGINICGVCQMSTDEINTEHTAWRPVSEMGNNHPHGLYLCLLQTGDPKTIDGYCVEERYFTYNKEHKAVFQSAAEGANVIAFLVPRFYNHYLGADETREELLQKEVIQLRMQIKKLKEEKEAQDHPWQFNVGDFVLPHVNSGHQLRSGCEAYEDAVVVSIDPFVLVSEEGDMRWEGTVKREDFELSSNQDRNTAKALARWAKEQEK
jgi:hypothetical protein